MDLGLGQGYPITMEDGTALLGADGLYGKADRTCKFAGIQGNEKKRGVSSVALADDERNLIRRDVLKELQKLREATWPTSHSSKTIWLEASCFMWSSG